LAGKNGNPRGSKGDCNKLQRVRCSGIAIGEIWTILVLRHCKFQRSGGVPMMSQRKRAWCRLSICWRVMLLVGIRSGRVLSGVRWSIVSSAIVPHDQGAKGESFYMAIRLTRR
jgi:hypothetical protein